MNTLAAKSTAFDQQGTQADTERVEAAMGSFVREFGRTTALHLESCVHCGLCADACHFRLTTGDPKYTPILKLEPFRRAYFREAGPFAPVVRALNLVKKPDINDLHQWQELLYDSCTMCGRCTLVCPMGIDIAELIKEARHGMFKAGLVPDRLALMDRTARQWGSTATPGEDLPDILAEISEKYSVHIPCDLAQADVLVTAAAAELGDHNIRCNAILPHAMSPGMQWWIESNPEEAHAFLSQIPQRRVGDCEQDIGRFVALLCSPSAEYVNGQTIGLDGGQANIG